MSHVQILYTSTKNEMIAQGLSCKLAIHSAVPGVFVNDCLQILRLSSYLLPQDLSPLSVIKVIRFIEVFIWTVHFTFLLHIISYVRKLHICSISQLVILLSVKTFNSTFCKALRFDQKLILNPTLHKKGRVFSNKTKLYNIASKRHKNSKNQITFFTFGHFSCKP